MTTTDITSEPARTIAGTESAAATRRQRFTVDGSDGLESHLAGMCDKILAGVRGLVPARKLEAILLGGGYGRGEGGVLRTPEGDKPYNDLEFYVALRGNRHLNERLYQRRLEVFGDILTPLAGVEVEFKITSRAELERLPISMFSYDLVLGHRWLWGREELLARCAHHRVAEQIPLSEATRLLMNRCSGLLFARERLERRTFNAADADFVRRNIAKAGLALGDAVLAAQGQYHWSCRERHRRLGRLRSIEPLPWLGEVLARHADGVAFKLHPERSAASRAALQDQLHALQPLALQVWLRVEGWRLRASFASARDYALSPLDPCPETSRWRNVLVNLKQFGLGAIFSTRCFRHPRERVLRALTILLWDFPGLSGSHLFEWLPAAAGAKADSFAALVRAYADCWHRLR